MSGAADPRVDAGLPLALSARKGDPHYDKAAMRLSDRIEVLLDGERLDHVISYDAPRGEITRHRRDGKGAIVIERGELACETLTGKVEARWIKQAEAQHG